MLYPHSVGLLPCEVRVDRLLAETTDSLKALSGAILDTALILVCALNPGVSALIALWGLCSTVMLSK